MYNQKTVCVVVPAYNEEKLIRRTLEEMPAFVDRILVVDDASTDSTGEELERIAAADPRILVVRHDTNQGVGAAIRTGYIWCRENDLDVAVVMAGDAQMDPADLPRLLDPVVEDRADYTKGNRLATGEAWKQIPQLRYLGNAALTFLTKIASGYWHVTDSQSGYTAINRRALQLLPLEDIYPRYGVPNDILVMLNIYNMRVSDISVRPVYGIGERSDLKIGKILFSLSFLIVRLFFRRMIQKHVIRDFHPLVLFYAFGFFLLSVEIPLIVRLLLIWGSTGRIPPMNALTVVFCTFMGFQSILFAMLFDMEANRELKGR